MLQTRLYYARKPPIFLFKRLMSGIKSPTLTSTGDPKKIITSLGLPRISTMILSGKPNRPFPAEYGVNIDEMTDGGKQAISLVTKCVQTGQWENLEGLLSNECIKGLRQSLDNITSEERSTIGVNDDDIFFSFIPEFQFEQTKQSIMLVTLSMPRLGELRQIIGKNKEAAKAVMDQIQSDVKAGIMAKEEAATEIPKKMKESLEQLKNEHQDSDTIFRSNDIVIGNYRFERENSNYEWTIVELSQIDSRNAWSYLFHRRWKGRLGISLRGFDFYTILRWDYITDWFAILVFFNFISASLMRGKKTVTKMNDSPESEVAASWMECSIYQNYTASEVLVQGIAGVINQKDVELIVRAQKKMLQRFEKTNEMLTNVNSLSATRLERAQADFKKHSQTVDAMKKDLEYIFKKIHQIKGKLSSQHPEAYAAATQHRPVIQGEEDDEYDIIIREAKLAQQQQDQQ